jgi:hypothetical protein
MSESQEISAAATCVDGMPVSTRDPIAAADLSRIRAADAVLAAALAWEQAANGRLMSEGWIDRALN